MLLIDGMMLAHRCRAKMDFLKNARGEPTGMEFGFLRTVEMLMKKYAELKIVVCWESPSGVSWRKEHCPAYKAHRSQPSPSFFGRLHVLREFLRCFWDEADADGYEADDVMFSLSRTDGRHYVYTNDDDLLQAVTPACTVVKAFESKLYEWTIESVRDKYGVLPEHLPDLRAFLGDGSDALTGVKRIDRKYLAVLVEWAYDTDASVTDAVKLGDWTPREKQVLMDFIDSGRWLRNYELMRLSSVPLTLRSAEMHEDTVVAALQRWEVRTLRLCEAFRGVLSSTLIDEKF